MFSCQSTPKIKVIVSHHQPPSELDCGGIHWQVLFNLERKSPNGGYIIQEVTTNFNRVDTCVSGQKKKSLPPSLTFYEAWEIAPGDSMPKSRASGAKPYDDLYKVVDLSSLSGFTSCKGSYTITGQVKYVDKTELKGGKLPDYFVVGNDTTKAYTGSLPATVTKPAFWSANNTTSHNLEVKDFVCCEDQTLKQATYRYVPVK